MNGAEPAGGPDARKSNLGYWLSDARAEFPNRVALIDLSRPTPREVTYSELDERMDRVANLLSDNGTGSATVSRSASATAQFVEIMFGAMPGRVRCPSTSSFGRVARAHFADADCGPRSSETASRSAPQR